MWYRAVGAMRHTPLDCLLRPCFCRGDCPRGHGVLQPTPSSVRCAPASGAAERLAFGSGLPMGHNHAIISYPLPRRDSHELSCHHSSGICTSVCGPALGYP